MKTFVTTATSCQPQDYILKNNTFHETRSSEKMGRGMKGTKTTVNIQKSQTLSIPSLKKYILTSDTKYNLSQKYGLWMS
jgi:hypothetical protein